MADEQACSYRWSRGKNDERGLASNSLSLYSHADARLTDLIGFCGKLRHPRRCHVRYASALVLLPPLIGEALISRPYILFPRRTHCQLSHQHESVTPVVKGKVCKLAYVHNIHGINPMQ